MWILWDIMISGNLTRLGGIELETCKLGDVCSWEIIELNGGFSRTPISVSNGIWRYEYEPF